MSRNTIARIDLSAIRANLARIRSMVGNSRVACVVKADAYGHGLSNIVPALHDADVLAVATVGEAERCRQYGWSGRLLMLEGPANADEIRAACEHRCELVIHHASQLKLLERAPRLPQGPYWLKLDSGMHRLGFPTDQVGTVHAALRRVSGDQPVILMSHFACADDPANPMTQEQLARFDRAVNGFEGEVSLANSAAVMNFPASHRDIVRPGIMLYGVSPRAGQPVASLGLKPAMTLQAELVAINQVARGEPVGYGAEQRCPRDMPVGVAAIGYGDGYPRGLRQGAPVLINGRRAGLIGPVSMDLTTIDLSDHPEASVGDTVTLWGEGLPVEELATWANAIPYELICGVTARVHMQVLPEFIS